MPKSKKKATNAAAEISAEDVWNWQDVRTFIKQRKEAKDKHEHYMCPLRSCKRSFKKEHRHVPRLDKHMSSAHPDVDIPMAEITNYVRREAKDFFDEAYLQTDDSIRSLATYHGIEEWRVASILRSIGCYLVLDEPEQMERAIDEGIKAVQYQPSPHTTRQPQFSEEWSHTWTTYEDKQKRDHRAPVKPV